MTTPAVKVIPGDRLIQVRLGRSLFPTNTYPVFRENMVWFAPMGTGYTVTGTEREIRAIREHLERATQGRVDPCVSFRTRCYNRLVILHAAMSETSSNI